ncbi:MAG: hypothetical protein ACI81R_002154 [Bradymonadia bacterium]|jgi:hypothetical protein
MPLDTQAIDGLLSPQGFTLDAPADHELVQRSVLPLAASPSASTPVVRAHGDLLIVSGANMPDVEVTGLEGGAASSRDGSLVGPLPLRRSPRVGHVAVVTDSTPMLERLLLGLQLHSAGPSFACSLDNAGHMGLAAAIDRAARHRDTAALVVSVHPSHWMGAIDVLSAVLRALPVILLDIGGGLQDQAVGLRWMVARGTQVHASVSDTCVAAAIAASMPLPNGERVLLLSRDPSTLSHWAAEATLAGFDAVTEERAPGQPPRELDLSFDLVFVDDEVDVIPIEAVPVVLCGVGNSRWLDPPFEPIAALMRWEASGRLPAMPSPADTHALRRALSSGDATPAAASSLLQSLGLGVLQSERVAYLEDAHVSAATLGYPVRVGMHLPDVRPSMLPPAVTVPNIDTLTREGERMLAQVRKDHGKVGSLTVARPLERAIEVLLSAHRDPTYGPTVILRCADAQSQHVWPLQPHELDAVLGVMADDAIAQQGLFAACKNALAALYEATQLRALEISLHVAPSGVRASAGWWDVGAPA